MQCIILTLSKEERLWFLTCADSNEFTSAKYFSVKTKLILLFSYILFGPAKDSIL